ncbi:hypothetical protein AB0M47_39360, partial [Hamadaea sp. NPDC051192]|uniref:hypothetical protein n=1 Tax=Hamadaea sp. NPDC051192 TaxID=3154940 RepID=UPI00343A1C6F
DPDGYDRTPGRRSRTLVHTKRGTKLLRNPAATLAEDPAFKEVAESVRQHRGGDTYNAYRRRLNTEIKRIMAGPAQSGHGRILNGIQSHIQRR